MRWIIWPLRLELTAIALGLVVTFGLSVYWWVTFQPEPNGWPDFDKLSQILCLLVVTGPGLLFFGPLAVVVWPRPWRRVLLLGASWAGSTTAVLFAVGALSELALVLIPASLFSGWRLCCSIQAVTMAPRESGNGERTAGHLWVRPKLREPWCSPRRLTMFETAAKVLALDDGSCRAPDIERTPPASRSCQG